MKNMQFTSPATDREFFISLYAFLFCLGLFGFAGYQILNATGVESYLLKPLATVISAGLGGFVWGIFGIFEPAHYHRNWAVKKYAGITLVWLMLVLFLVLWFQHLNNDPGIIHLEEYMEHCKY